MRVLFLVVSAVAVAVYYIATRGERAPFDPLKSLPFGASDSGYIGDVQTGVPGMDAESAIAASLVAKPSTDYKKLFPSGDSLRVEVSRRGIGKNTLSFDEAEKRMEAFDIDISKYVLGGYSTLQLIPFGAHILSMDQFAARVNGFNRDHPERRKLFSEEALNRLKQYNQNYFFETYKK